MNKKSAQTQMCNDGVTEMLYSIFRGISNCSAVKDI